jgi:hypothetical protein
VKNLCAITELLCCHLAFALCCYFFSYAVFAQTPAPTAVNLPVKAAAQTVADAPVVKSNSAAADLIVENLVQSGDVLEIDVLGSLEYDWRGRADDEGFLSSLPSLSVSVPALCRTETEIAAEIAAAYSKFLRNPQVVVRVIDRTARQPAVLLGAIKTEQRFRILRPVSLSELIAASGGITEEASGEVQIFRPAHVSCAADGQKQPESQTIRIKLSDLLAGNAFANPQIRAGDIVTIEQAQPIYVTGGVVAPQKIFFRSGLSVARAVAGAGGVSATGEAARITVFRRRKSSAELEIIKADLTKILRGQAEDIALAPFDIVEVAQRGRAASNRPPIGSDFADKPLDIGKLPLREIN